MAIWEPMSFGEPSRAVLQRLLREVRIAAGLTQAELASRLSQPQSFVSKCESGERRVDVIELRAICEACGLSLREFVRRFEAEIPQGEADAGRSAVSGAT